MLAETEVKKKIFTKPNRQTVIGMDDEKESEDSVLSLRFGDHE